MTLKEMKIKVFSLIEEYYPEKTNLAEDEDVLNKINGVINQIQMDLMKYRKISANTTIEVGESDDKIINIKDYISDCYQINRFYFKNDIDYEMPDDDTLILPSDFTGEFTIYYYKYPELTELIFKDDNARQKHDIIYEFELDDVLLEIMPYGVAADLLKLDMISNYGRDFYNRYMELKNNIDTRKNTGVFRVVGGLDV